MINYKLNNFKRQAGMTLIELTVVLLILIGLAGLLIPYVGSFVQKTHDSTNSNNLTQLNNAFVRYVSENGKLPQHMDSLTNDTVSAVGTGACSGTPVAGSAYCGLLDGGVFAPVVYAQTLNPMDESSPAAISYNSLVKSKIGMAINNLTTAPNKTFGSTATIPADMIMISNSAAMGGAGVNFTGIKVGSMRDGTGAVIAASDAATQDHLAAALGKAPMDYRPTCYDYVAFGLGDANGLVSKTIAQSPVHFPEDATKGPVEYYNHYMAIVQVDKNNGAGCTSITEAAKFLGVVMNVPAYPTSHLFGANASLAYAYQNQLEGK